MTEAQSQGQVIVVGMGPGPERWMTPEVLDALRDTEILIGYGPYLDRVTPEMTGAERIASDNRVELDRSRDALERAASGQRVAVVSGGDPGIFAMAAAVFEAVEAGPDAWRALDIMVLPGVTAMTAAAARLGAPLGHDFCAISLSVNLKPWSVVEKRLRAAAEADFVIALYNPVSKARPNDLDKAFDVLRTVISPATIVMFASAIGRADESVRITTLQEAGAQMADMRTLVIIGSSQTRMIERSNGREPFIYTPRSYDVVGA